MEYLSLHGRHQTNRILLTSMGGFRNTVSKMTRLDDHFAKAWSGGSLLEWKLAGFVLCILGHLGSAISSVCGSVPRILR